MGYLERRKQQLGLLRFETLEDRRMMSVSTETLVAVDSIGNEASTSSAAVAPLTTLNPDPSWYVGDTEAGEWVEFTDVYLSDGSYRVTGHLGALDSGNLVEISLNGSTIGTVAVPDTDNFETFELLHLGSTVVTAGYYDIRLTFVTGDVSADMIYLRKSSDLSTEVLLDDLANPQPSATDGAAVSPIFTRDSKGYDFPVGRNGYSDVQNLAWYKQPLYTEMLDDDSLYAQIDEQIAARVDFAWLHGKYTVDTDDWGYDRDYVPENGDGGSRKTVRMFEVLEQHPFGEYLKFAYFVDNAIYGSSYENSTGNNADWGSTDFQQFIWNHWTKPWFDAVPADRLYFDQDGYALINFWTANNGVDNPAGMVDFFNDTISRVASEYGHQVRVVLNGSFFNANSTVSSVAYARQPWFGWGNASNSSFATENGVTAGFLTNGRKLPISSIWETDWDPVTNTGTRKNANTWPDDGEYRSTHTNGVADFRTAMLDADANGAQWVMLEAWANHLEGSTWFRSDHVDNNHPNEFINIAREFADKSTESVLLQIEGADEYLDLSSGNSGQEYRYHWHEGAEPDLDIFRPRRNIDGFTQFASSPANLVALTGGDHEIWAIDSSGGSWATEMDGNSPWADAKDNGLSFLGLELGRQTGFALVGTDVYRANFPTGWDYWNTNDWAVFTGTNYVDISANIVPNQLWAINPLGGVAVSDQDVSSFISVPGVSLTDIAAGEKFVWGITTEGLLTRHRSDLTGAWQSYENSLGLVKLFAGSNEIWGITAAGDLYRMTESGASGLQFVMGDVTSVGLAREFVWVLKSDNTVHWSKLSGFAETEGSVTMLTSSHPLDFNDDGVVDTLDYGVLMDNMFVSPLGGLPGDLTGDDYVDFEDHRAFRDAYELLNGVGSFSAMVAEVSALNAADFNGDGAVNGSDFLSWQRVVNTDSHSDSPDGDTGQSEPADSSFLVNWANYYSSQTPTDAVQVAPDTEEISVTRPRLPYRPSPQRSEAIELAMAQLALNDATRESEPTDADTVAGSHEAVDVVHTARKPYRVTSRSAMLRAELADSEFSVPRESIESSLKEDVPLRVQGNMRS